MRQIRTKTIQEEVVVCDRCHRHMVQSDPDCEHQERVAIRFRAGYGSVFDDGNLVEMDICQHCLQEVLGKYLHITNDDPFDPKHKLEESVGAYQESQLQNLLATENLLRNFREALQARRPKH